MKPGRELDALVAEKVMAWRKGSQCEPLLPPLDSNQRKYQVDGLIRLPDYSTDIAAAWEVLEKLAGCNTKALFYHDVYVQWQCNLDSQRRTFDDCRISAMGDTAPHAICLAALKSLGINPE